MLSGLLVFASSGGDSVSSCLEEEEDVSSSTQSPTAPGTIFLYPLLTHCLLTPLTYFLLTLHSFLTHTHLTLLPAPFNVVP